MTTTSKPRRRRGGTDQDGIIRRRSTVTIELDAMGGMLYDKPTYDTINRETPGFLGNARQDIIEKHYIITTRRYGSGGRWEVVINHEGKDWRLPDEVLAAIRRHYETIIKAQRQENAEESARKRRAAALELEYEAEEL